jgi:hypothetical protein
VKGEPSPVDRGKLLSEPGDIVPVRIEVEPDSMRWPALYCPRQNRIVGPHSKFFADTLQQTFNLILRDNRLHLVHTSGKGQPRRNHAAEPERRHCAVSRRRVRSLRFFGSTTRASPKIRPSLRLATFMANGAMVLFVGAAFYTVRR